MALTLKMAGTVSIFLLLNCMYFLTYHYFTYLPVFTVCEKEGLTFLYFLDFSTLSLRSMHDCLEVLRLHLKPLDIPLHMLLQSWLLVNHFQSCATQSPTPQQPVLSPA